MNQPFKGQVAIVTGAGQGIGFEVARQLAAGGAAVVLNDLDEALALDAEDKIRQEKGICRAVIGDSADELIIRKLVDTAVSAYGRLDLAVANTGVTLYGSFLDYPESSLQKVLHVNMAGTFLFVQSAARRMKTQGHGGRILLMSSVTGNQAHPNLAAYAMTKAGLQMLARNLVIELSPWQITINALAPGATLTERTRSDDPSYEKNWSVITPTGRPATPEDIAYAALFFLHPSAGHITGQTLTVDGGWTALSPAPDLTNMN